MEVRVLADTQPEGMTQTTPTLEDVYFATLRQHAVTARQD